MSHEEITIDRFGHIYKVNGQNRNNFKEAIETIAENFQELSPQEEAQKDLEEQEDSIYEMGKEDGYDKGLNEGYEDARTEILELLEVLEQREEIRKIIDEIKKL